MKKVVAFIATLVMAFSCALGLVACGEKFDEGTYILYALYEEEGEKIAYPSVIFHFKDGKIFHNEDEYSSGTYKMDGGKLVAKFGEETMEFSQVDGMWQCVVNDIVAALIKKGSRPNGYTVPYDGDDI